MRRLTSTRPSPALAVSILALIVGLTGTATAIELKKITSSQLAKDAVRSKKIKDRQVKNADLATDAITSDRVLDGQIATEDLADGAVNAGKLDSDAVTTPALADQAVTEPKIGAGAVSTAKFAGGAKAPAAGRADDALRLGGVLPAGYQKSCESGAIKGSVVANTSGLPPNGAFQTVPGFNCAPGGIVQIRKDAIAGDYRVRFVPDPGSGSAVVSLSSSTHQAGTGAITNDPMAPGETVFQVLERDAAGGPIDGVGLTLLAF